MKEVMDYCDQTYKRLVGLKAGLYDVMTAAEKVSDSTHAEQAKQLKSMVESIENGIEELRNQCPPDWSPNKNRLEESLERLSKALSEMADQLEVTVPDTTAWI
jgi:hypothetical protein